MLSASLLALLILLSLASLARAQEGGPAHDERIDHIVSVAPDQPGAVVAVIRNGRPVMAQAYGLADLTHQIPFGTGTRTNLGSTSKQFTAFALASLAARGELSLDDDVRKFVPELPDFGTTVTLRHLLTHTSGYRELYLTLALAGRRPFEDHIDRAEVVQIVQRQRALQNRPGHEWNYNNTGYALLALVVERVSGIPFPEWMRQHVFTPLGMKDTSVRADPGQIIAHSARGYAPTTVGYRETKDLDAAMGASAVYSTVEDVARWIGNFGSSTKVDPTLFAQMTTPVISTGVGDRKYGLGLYLDEWKGLRRIFHHGDDVAHRFAFIYFPDLDAGVVVGSNNASFNAVRAALQIADLYFGDQTRPAAAEVTEAAVTPLQLSRYAGIYELESGPGPTFTFTHEDNRLWVTAAGERFELLPAGGARFQVKGQMVQVEFQDTGAETVSSATIIDQGRQRLKRAVGDRPENDRPDLKLYSGRYYSEELEITYALRVEENALVLRHARLPTPVKLNFVHGDRFSGEEPASSLVFERDERGQIAGFRAGNGSNREYVRFAKES